MCGASDAGGQRTEDPWSGRCLPVRRGCSWPGPLEKPHTRDEKLREQRPSRVEPFPCENSLPFDMGVELRGRSSAREPEAGPRNFVAD